MISHNNYQQWQGWERVYFLFLEQACRHLIWSLRATWRLRALCWWPLCYSVSEKLNPPSDLNVNCWPYGAPHTQTQCYIITFQEALPCSLGLGLIKPEETSMLRQFIRISYEFREDSVIMEFYFLIKELNCVVRSSWRMRGIRISVCAFLKTSMFRRGSFLRLFPCSITQSSQSLLKEMYYGVFPTSKHSKWVPENMFLKLFAWKKILPTTIPLCLSPFRMRCFWCL